MACRRAAGDRGVDESEDLIVLKKSIAAPEDLTNWRMLCKMVRYALERREVYVKYLVNVIELLNALSFGKWYKDRGVLCFFWGRRHDGIGPIEYMCSTISKANSSTQAMVILRVNGKLVIATSS